MHALFITYTASLSREDLREPYRQLAQSLAGGALPGMVSKTWLYDGSTHGGFCVFRDRAAADRYLSEMVQPGIAGGSVFSNVRVERYEVNDELSALTRDIAAASAVA